MTKQQALVLIKRVDLLNKNLNVGGSGEIIYGEINDVGSSTSQSSVYAFSSLNMDDAEDCEMAFQSELEPAAKHLFAYITQEAVAKSTDLLQKITQLWTDVKFIAEICFL